MKITLSFILKLGFLAFLTSKTVYAQTESLVSLGVQNFNPGYNFSPGCNDIVNGINYYFLSNNKVTVNFGTTSVNNDQAGSKHPGAIMDVVLEKTNLDNLDWTQFMINNDQNFDLTNTSKMPMIDSLRLNFSDNSFNVYGKEKFNPNLKLHIKYTLLENEPIIRFQIKLKNTGNTILNKYLGYVIDVDEAIYTDSYHPILGYNTGDYSVIPKTGNYVFYGSRTYQNSNKNVHGLSWIEKTPDLFSSNPMNFGIHYKISLNPNDSVEIVFYQLVSEPNPKTATGTHFNIANLALIPLTLDKKIKDNYRLLKGVIEDQNNVRVSNVKISILYNDKYIINTTSDLKGQYQLILADTFKLNGTLKVELSAIGYKTITKKIPLDTSSFITVRNFTKRAYGALEKVNIDAAFNKDVKANGVVSQQPGDLVMENNLIVAVIANSSRQTITKGDVIDFYIKNSSGNNIELLDWMKPNKLSFEFDSLDKWITKTNLIVDTIFIKYKDNFKVIAELQGRVQLKGELANINPSEIENSDIDDSIPKVLKNIKFVTQYELLVNSSNLKINTSIINYSNTVSFNFLLGDALKTMGGSERTFIPEIGEIKNDFGLSSNFLYKSTESWMAHFGKEPFVYGITYHKIPMMKYGVRRWVSSINALKVSPNDTSHILRYLNVFQTNNETHKEKFILNAYLQQNNFSDKINIELKNNSKFYQISDTLILSIEIKNFGLSSHYLNINLNNPYFLKPIDSIKEVFLLPRETKKINLRYQIIEGGKDEFHCRYTVDSTYDNIKSTQIFIKAPGWFTGDNHTHSLFSDGGSTIENNVLYARSKNLSFITATDHNTISHYNEVNRLNSKYADMLVLQGNEITTSQVHMLAYNSDKNIPWVLNNTWTQQKIIDTVRKNINQNGRGFLYVAHPFDPVFYWRYQKVDGLKGIEVWNGFNLNFNFSDIASKNSFAMWDSLNLQGKKLLGISGSDAHNALDVGNNFIRAYLAEFSQSEVIKVLRDKGCYYGSNGPHINFNINNKMMGSNVYIDTNKPVIFSITANSLKPNIKILEIRLIRNGVLYKTWLPNSTIFSQKFIDSVSSASFFRIEVVCTNNHFAFSNPIWVNINQPTYDDTLSIDTAVRNSIDKIDSNFRSQILNINQNKNEGSSLIVYPNPTTRYLYVRNLDPKSSYIYNIYDINCRLVLSGDISKLENEIELYDLNDGYYVITIQNDKFHFKQIFRLIK